MDARNINTLTKLYLRTKGFPSISLQECRSENDFSSFSESLSYAVDHNNFGPYVDKQPPEKLKEDVARVFLSGDKMAGVAVWPDGNIGALFKDKRAPYQKAIGELVLTALSVGGKKLDCYNGFLCNAYAEFGFIPVARVKFNPKYSPPNWRKEFGEPDVIFWIHCGDSVLDVAKKIGHYPEYSPEDIAELPCFPNYERAYEYRDNYLLGKL